MDVFFRVAGGLVVGSLKQAGPSEFPIVLLLHGFTGSRDEKIIPSDGRGIFAYVADKLASEGLSSLRIDFRGSGDSDGTFEDTTYSSQIADGVAAIDFLAHDPALSAKPIFVLGWSQGGLVATSVAARSPRVAGLALWAAVGEPIVSMKNLFGREMFERGLKTDRTLEIPLPWGFSISLKRPFFEEVLTHAPLAEIARYHGPLFVAEGLNDKSVVPGTGEKFIAAHNGQHTLWRYPMDHVFNTGAGTGDLDCLIDATMKFFSALMSRSPASVPGTASQTAQPSGKRQRLAMPI